MKQTSAIPEPESVAGIVLWVFSGWLALEAVALLSVPQLAIAVAFFVLGWLLRRRGAARASVAEPAGPSSLRRWARFFSAAIPVLLVAYVLGYFVLMDRHRPTAPAAEFVHFQSSLRWAPREWVHKAVPPYETPWGSVTTWNVIYQPMDRLWFRFFPRSDRELDRLRELGYWKWRELRP